MKLVIPMPEPPPVTKATLPLTLKTSSILKSALLVDMVAEKGVGSLFRIGFAVECFFDTKMC